MIVAPIVVIFLGYTAASYGYVLMRSWEIPFRAWISPLHPYQYPQGGPPKMPDGQLFPGGPVAAGTESATPPAGVSPAVWTQIITCLSRGGLCTPSELRSIGGAAISKLFGL